MKETDVLPYKSEKSVATTFSLKQDLRTSNSAELNNRKQPGQKPIYVPPDTCSDLVVMKNGDEFTGKVMDTAAKKIKYFDCDKKKIVTVPGRSVFMVKFASGATRMPSDKDDRIYSDFALATFILAGLMSLYLISPVGIVTAIIALVQIKKHPEKYKGKAMVILGLILCTLATILAAFILIVFML